MGSFVSSAKSNSRSDRARKHLVTESTLPTSLVRQQLTLNYRKYGYEIALMDPLPRRLYDERVFQIHLSSGDTNNVALRLVAGRQQGERSRKITC